MATFVADVSAFPLIIAQVLAIGAGVFTVSVAVYGIKAIRKAL